MGRRKHDLIVRERDDLLVSVPAAAAKADDAKRPQTLADRAFSLQRTYGNNAVTIAVQRKERPQSTDAPWVKKLPPTEEEQMEDLAPTSSNTKLGDYTDADLVARGHQEMENGTLNGAIFATKLYEEYWFRRKERAVALNLYRAYKKVGDEKHAKYWLGVLKGTIKPGAKKDEDDMSDKHF